jgi:KDO2-lipid IV(A) lauroyltransferase
VWKQSVFDGNLRLTKPFFENANMKQPKYGEVLRNMLCDIFDFIFCHPASNKNTVFKIDENSISVLEEMRHGGIFLTAHYGNHEFLGYRLAELGLPLNAAAQEQKPELYNKKQKKKRTFNGKAFAEKIETKHLIKFIDKGGLFALIADQNFRKPVPRLIREKCESKFLGVKVRCNPLPVFILEHRAKTSVFCGYLRQLCHIQTLFLKKLPAENFYNSYHSWLENLILENPSKWYGWVHKRF